MLTSLKPLVALGREPRDGLEAPDLPWRPVAAVDRGLFVRRACFGGVEQVVEGAPDLDARLAVGELEPEARPCERGGNTKEKDGVLCPGENEQHGERRPEDTP